MVGHPNFRCSTLLGTRIGTLCLRSFKQRVLSLHLSRSTLHEDPRVSRRESRSYFNTINRSVNKLFDPLKGGWTEIDCDLSWQIPRAGALCSLPPHPQNLRCRSFANI